jgi:anti-anti-sigma factor
MELYHEIQENAFVVILSGSLDNNDTNEIDSMLKKAIKSCKSNIIVDCYNLNYISSGGVGVFLANLPSIKAHKMELIFCNMQPNTRKVFNFLGVESLVKIVDIPHAV